MEDTVSNGADLKDQVSRRIDLAKRKCLTQLDELKDFEIVIPGKDEMLERPVENYTSLQLEEFSEEQIKNRRTYDICSGVAWYLRLADSGGFKDEKFVKEVKEKIGENKDLEFYIAFLVLTEAFETEQDYSLDGLELDGLSLGFGKYLLETVTSRTEKTNEIRDFEMLEQVMARMTVNLPESSSGETYFGMTEFDNLWQAVEKRKESMQAKPGFGDIFGKMQVAKEKVDEYKREYQVNKKEQ